jgi:hypothetical protein
MNDCDKKDELKQAIYDQLPPRRRKFIDRIGFDRWDPFQDPKDPIEWRTDITQRTTQQLVRKFLQECKDDNYNTAYSRGVVEVCHGLINNDDRFRGVFEFCIWYQSLLQREGKLEKFKEQLNL